MSSLKARLEADMTQAMKARDELKLNTLRMVLTAVKNAEVAGKTARDLSDEEVQKVIAHQAKQRAEAAQAWDDANRVEQAERERAEGRILAEYLPKQLDAAELEALVDEVFTREGFDSSSQMGKVMKAVQLEVKGRAGGKEISQLVKTRLSS